MSNPTLKSVSVSLSPVTASVALGGTQQLTASAIGTMSDNSTVSLSAKYESSNPAIVTVSQSGLVTAICKDVEATCQPWNL